TRTRTLTDPRLTRDRPRDRPRDRDDGRPMTQHRTQPASAVEVTRLSLRATAGGGCRVAGGGGAFRAVQQRVTRTSARVALVPDRALLIAGDDVALEVEVDP